MCEMCHRCLYKGGLENLSEVINTYGLLGSLLAAHSQTPPDATLYPLAETSV